MDNLKLWHKFLSVVKPLLSASNYRAFFTVSKLSGFDDNQITISTPSAFIKETLNQKHMPLIERSFEQITGGKKIINFIVKEYEMAKEEIEMEDFFQPVTSKSNVLNPKYSLANFVVGPSNNVAFAAATAVSQNPGTSYNPLFLYGGTGVGKTHLMIAIGNAISGKKPHSKIIYCSSEGFMNDYVEAIQNHKMTALRKKYRSSDILLVDDIQFFSGREGTQEEFFHTFNDLVGKNSQIVLTSDRSPHDIEKLEDRLKSRFAGGLMIDIQAPDFDTRVAILRAKCMEQKVSISESALAMLASSFNTNIREIEGKLVGILQVLKAQNLPPTEENLGKYLKNTSNSTTKTEPKQVLSIISSYFNLNQKDLTGSKRQKEFVLPRHIAMFILSEQLNLTVDRVGQMFGGRDHTTVMHGRDKIKKLIVEENAQIKKLLTEIGQKMRNS